MSMHKLIALAATISLLFVLIKIRHALILIGENILVFSADLITC